VKIYNLLLLVILPITLPIFFCADDGKLKEQETAESCNVNIDPTSLNNYSSDFAIKFQVKGNKIVDESGQEKNFRGLAIVDPVYHYCTSQPGITYDLDYLPWQEENFIKMKAWGANIIRLGIEPNSWQSQSNTDIFLILDEAIGWAAKQEMYVILDFHSIGFAPTNKYENGYKTTQKVMKSFWNSISSYYKDNNVVAFYEIFNEPFNEDGPATSSSWQTYKTYTEGIIDLIRTNDPDSVVIVGGLDHGYDLSQAITNPINKTNVVYAAHPYPDKTKWGRSWDEAFGNLKDSHPIFATEIGFDQGLSGEQVESSYVGSGLYRDDLKTYLTDKNISWTAWCFSIDWEPTLLIDKNYTPSDSGNFFKTWLQGF